MRIPRGKRPQTVIVGVVQEQVAEVGDEREEPEQQPSRRNRRLLSSQTMKTPAEERDHERDERRSQKCVGEAAMMLKGDQRPAEAPRDVEVRRFGGQGHGQRGICGLAVEAGAAQACAGEEVGDGFHRFVKECLAFEGSIQPPRLHLYNP